MFPRADSLGISFWVSFSCEESLMLSAPRMPRVGDSQGVPRGLQGGSFAQSAQVPLTFLLKYFFCFSPSQVRQHRNPADPSEAEKKLV